ncbi:MAG TPA: 16S rRNA (guanine(966)-N(2))-methyltransferase RsmD [Vicinamibacterales bacterium]|nr:16S rRNA (guanine(966)-N(2))-methyltransferase RsmD [Vicinamibacterales bacterium]
MRIIAGDLKGRRLETPGWPGLRPTSDRLRETLFNILAPRIAGTRILDGYAGTGAVGIEALSRGAAHVTFVEQDARAQALIEANLRRCGVSDRYAIIRAGLAAATGRLSETFDIVFLDPPYGAVELATALEAGASLLGEHGLLVIEHATRDAAPGATPRLTRTRALTQGDSALAFYTHV